MKWILILSVWGSSPTAVPYFNTRAACIAAGDQWLETMRYTYNLRFNMFTAVCVQEGRGRVPQ